MTNHDNPHHLTHTLVLGAGELGMAMLRHLAPHQKAAGHPLAVLVTPGSLTTPTPRQVEDHAALRALDVQFVPFDLVERSHEDLVALLRQFDTVINCTGFVAGPGTQLRLTRAVLDAGVRRHIPWQFGVDYDIVGKGSGQPVFDEQFDVRGMLRGQDRTEWIIVSTGMFTSFLFEKAAGIVDLDAGVVRGLGTWATQVTVTTPDDIGRCTAAILFDEPRIANQVVYLASDTVSYGQLADIVESVTGRGVERILLTGAALQADLAAQPADPMARYRIAFARGDGMAWRQSTTYNAQRGIPTTNIRAWLENRVK
ncbi:aromatic alcohol reductase [Massilia aurea]|uniref:aromatic alcohol reductase n=1 Tax=Massilia aurea TaxID=373040 RepID=UPI0034629A9A